MPKFGLKCFLGSFILSLVAVFATTRAYKTLSDADAEKTYTSADIEAKNIELFAANEENDPILEKYNSLNQQNDFMENISPEKEADLSAPKAQKIASVETSRDEILFAPEEEDAAEEQLSEPVSDISDNPVQELIIEEPQMAENSPVEELKIVDAAEAPVFQIPLVHNFATTKEDIEISHQAAKNQLALADQSVPVENLGAENASAANTAVKNLALDSVDEEEDPWEVAEVANPNITRNKNAVIAQNETPANSNNVPYKMQKNILIPIPEDIANEKNLTPQFSSSAENIKLEEELRRKHGRPSLASEGIHVKSSSDASVQGGNNKANSATQNVSEKNSSNKSGAVSGSDKNGDVDDASITDSIAAWFSGNRKGNDKKSGSVGNGDDTNVGVDGNNQGGSSTKQQESSLFRKLLGLGAASNDNVAPTELKLSFQPDRAEISGQTLEWIKAFAENVVRYDDVAIEIRLDRTASYELQQKRLKLLYKILANNGVEYRKVNIIFTDREPNSFIIRNVRYVTKEEKAKVAAREKKLWF